MIETSPAAGHSVTAEPQDGVLVITIDRPGQRNAIDGTISEGLIAAIELLNSDNRLRVGVLTGAGGVFCSGMDLKAFAQAGLPAGLGPLLRDGSTHKPLIAAVEGYALAGGLELALACDMVVAARDARFGVPEAKVGLFAAGGGLLRLPQRLPVNVAMEMALTADPISAQRGYTLGLINRLAEPTEALADAITLANAITRCAPLSVDASRRLVRKVQCGADEDFWAFQAPLIKKVFRSSDAKEGPRAFSEKRPPAWQGE